MFFFPIIHRHPIVKRCGALCLAVLALVAPAAYADDLLSLYRAAVENDPRYRAAEASYNAVQQKVPQAWSSLLPRAQASAARNRNDERTITDNVVLSNPTGSAEYSSSEYSFSGTQPIVNFSAVAGLRQANAEVRRAEAEFATARQELIVRVAESYFQLLLAQDTHALARTEMETLGRHFEASQAKQRAGVSAISEVEDARARFQIAAAQEIDAANRVEDQRQALVEITRHAPAQLAPLANRTIALTLDPPEIERWLQISLDRNPAVIAAGEAVEAARQEVERLRREHYPTIDFVGSRHRTDAENSISGSPIRTDRAVVGFQLTVPLLQGGLVLSRTQEAAYRHDAALQELEARRRNTDRTVRASFRDVHGAATRVESLRQAIVAGEISLEAKTQGYRAGVYHTLDVLDATRELFRTKRDYSEARYAHLFAFLRLKQAAGTLDSDDLEQVSRWFRQ